MKRPSDKQIIFADKIAEKLNLSFPRGDYDFTAKAYYDFISDHIQEYKETFNFIPILEDENDIFWGYEYGLWEY